MIRNNSTRPEINRGNTLTPRIPIGGMPMRRTERQEPPVQTLEKQTTPTQSSLPKKQKFPSPPPVMMDKKGATHFNRGALLGEGGFAKCYEAHDIYGTKWAAKVVPKLSLKSSKQKQKLISEIKIHQTLSHSNIVRYKHVFEDDDNVYIILELCENGTFVDILKKRKRLTEPEVRFYMWQLLDGIRYMHRRSIIHRDLKLGNLFLTKDMNLKIGDFGLAASLKHDGERKKTICGTPNYIAPEILFDTQNGHSYEVDIWSLGVVMYTMLIGKPPFQTKDVKAIYKKIRDNSYEFPSNIPISENAKSIIGSLLHTRPECRPCIDDVMQHVFFKTQPILERVPVSALQTAPHFEEDEETLIDTTTVHSSELRRSIRLVPTSPNQQSRVSSESGRDVVSNTDILKSLQPPLPLMNSNPSRLTPPPLLAGSSKMEMKKPLPLTEVLNIKSHLKVEVKGELEREMKDKAKTEHKGESRPPLHPIIIQNAPVSTPSNPKGLLPIVSSPKKITGSLELMFQNLSNALAESSFHLQSNVENVAQLSIKDYCQDHPKIFITKWIDYSNKYGLGYQLRDGSVGVYFNDSTSIILSSDNLHFEYLYYDRAQDKPTTMHRRAHSLATFPGDLQKKVTLLKHFRSYMQENLNKAAPTNPEESSLVKVNNMHFLTKYLRTKHGVVFRLSNQILQLNLFDHTKLILSHHGQVVTYINKTRDMKTDSIHQIVSKNGREVFDRLSYLRDILEQMIIKKLKN